MNPKFKEEQKFTQWWLWHSLIGIGFLPIYGIYKQLIIGKQFGERPIFDIGLIVFSIFVFGLILMFRLMKITTEINQNEISMHFFPFTRKEVKWNEIKIAEIVNYGFVGGWGIRLWTRYGTIYNTKGNKGLAIELKSGKKFLIGTQKENELSELLEKLVSDTVYSKY